jgi:hypothetical protein
MIKKIKYFDEGGSSDGGDGGGSSYAFSGGFGDGDSGESVRSYSAPAPVETYRPSQNYGSYQAAPANSQLLDAFTSNVSTPAQNTALLASDPSLANITHGGYVPASKLAADGTLGWSNVTDREGNLIGSGISPADNQTLSQAIAADKTNEFLMKYAPSLGGMMLGGLPGQLFSQLGKYAIKKANPGYDSGSTSIGDILGSILGGQAVGKATGVDPSTGSVIYDIGKGAIGSSSAPTSSSSVLPDFSSLLPFFAGSASQPSFLEPGVLKASNRVSSYKSPLEGFAEGGSTDSYSWDPLSTEYAKQQRALEAQLLSPVGSSRITPVAVDRSHHQNIPLYANGGPSSNPAPLTRGMVESGIHSPEFMSEGGMQHHYVQGGGTGTSDSVPAMLATGEFVFPADVVASLGDGDNKAGAEILDEFMQVIRKHKRNAPPSELPPDSKGPLAYLAEATSAKVKRGKK